MDLQQSLRELWVASGLSQDEFVSHATMASASETERLTIWYHGTDESAAESIRREGFRPWTYFGEHLEDALGYGGGYVFEVAFPADWRAEAGWQMRVPDHVSPDLIVAHYVLQTTEVFENEELRERVFDSNEEAPRIAAEVKPP